MVFHRKQKKVSEINVAIDNTVIERAQSFNFLGVMLNKALSWKNHIAMVSNKISKVIGILYRLKYVFPEVCYLHFTILLWFRTLIMKLCELVGNSQITVGS